jgi:hypothetical protein
MPSGIFLFLIVSFNRILTFNHIYIYIYILLAHIFSTKFTKKSLLKLWIKKLKYIINSNMIIILNSKVSIAKESVK